MNLLFKNLFNSKKALLGVFILGIMTLSCADDGDDGDTGAKGDKGAKGDTGDPGAPGKDGASVGLVTEETEGCKTYTFFTDTNNDGIQDQDEQIIGNHTLCDGTEGTAGEDGLTVGISIIDQDNDCQIIDLFADLNKNGSKEEGETSIERFPICSGTDGNDGSPVGVALSAVSKTECPTGGFKVLVFLDSNFNYVQDSGETVLSTATKCYAYDTDGDGVLDDFDTEINTPPNTTVNATGTGYLGFANNGVSIIAIGTATATSYTLSGTTYTVMGSNSDLEDAYDNGVDLSLVVTTKVTNLDSFFYAKTSFNTNIGSWDTSNVTSMNAMFKDASSFNQDLSNWCVSKISSEPEEFKSGAIGAVSWSKPKPIWGSCP